MTQSHSRLSEDRIRLMTLVTEDWYFWSHRADLAKSLQARNYDIYIGTRTRQYRDAICRAGLQLVELPFRRSLNNPLIDLLATVKVYLSIRKIKPLIVHAVALKPIIVCSPAVLLCRNVRFVHALAGMGYLFSSDDKRARWMRRIVTTVLRFAMRRNNSWVIVQNEDDRQVVLRLGLAESKRVHLIAGSGVDTMRFTPSVQASLDPAPLVILPARMIRDKGIMEFIEAARRLRVRFPAARFALVGALDYDNPAAISQSEIESWTNEASIEWWGHRGDMVEVYQQASVVCLPSYREGLPKVLLEAAACGCALVATDVPGCRDICIDNETGLLVAARNVDELCAALETLLAQPEIRERLARSARHLVAQRYALPIIVEQTDRLYREIAQHESSQP